MGNPNIAAPASPIPSVDELIKQRQQKKAAQSTRASKRRLAPTSPGPSGEALLQDVLGSPVRGILSPVTTIADLTYLGIQQAGAPLPPLEDLPVSTAHTSQLLGVPPSAQSLPAKAIEGLFGALPFGLGSLATKTGRQLAGRSIPAAAGQTVVRPALEGATGGLAAGLAESHELTAPFAPFAAIGGGLAGGGAANITTNVARGGKKLIPGVRRQQFKQEANELIGSAVGDVAEGTKNIQRAAELNKELGLQLSVSDIVPTVQSLSRAMRQQGASIDDLARQRAQKNLSTVADRFDELAPTGAGTVEDAVTAVKGTQREQQALREAQLTGATSQFDETLSTFPPTGQETATIAQQGRQSLETAEKAAKARVDALWQPLNAQFATLPVDTAFVKNAAQSLPKKLSVAETSVLGTKAPLDELLTQIEALPGRTTIKELRGIQSLIMQAQREQRAALAPNTKILSVLDSLNKGTEAALIKTSRLAGNLGLRQQFNTARLEWKKFRDTYSRGTVGEVLRAGVGGAEHKRSSGDFVSLLLSDNRKFPERFADLKAALGDDAANQLVADMAMADLGQKLRDPLTGTLRPNTPSIVESWIKQHGHLPRQVAPLKDALTTLRRGGESITQATQSLKAPIDILDNQMAKSILTEDPDKIAKAFLTSGDPGLALRQLRTATRGNDAAFRGVSKAVWNALGEKSRFVPTSRTTTGGLGSKALGVALHKHENQLRELYGNNTYERLVAIQEGAVFAEGGDIRTLFNIDIPKSELVDLQTRIASRAFAIARKVIGVPFVTAERVGRITAKALDNMRREELQAVLDQTLHSPELIEAWTSITDANSLSKSLFTMKAWAARNVGTVAPTLQSVSDPRFGFSQTQETQQ